MAALRRLAAGYDRLNTTRPVLTKSLTSSLMLGASDIVCQKLVPSSHDASGGLDVQRAARMASWGLLVNGPIGHLWYLGLERMVRIQGALAIAAKVAIDQLVWTPPLTALFFTYEGCLQGETLDEAKGCAAEKLWPTLKANWVVRRPRQSRASVMSIIAVPIPVSRAWQVWPVVHLCTFSVVPLNYRVLWVNCANFVWSGFLSMQAHSSGEGPGKAMTELTPTPADKKAHPRRSQSVAPKV